ncbi:hypothetical protein MMC07_006273 [Pseudocyphellaria aurata]|nr:hypothetical protein [Pseudocyphellaria aurata]
MAQAQLPLPKPEVMETCLRGLADQVALLGNVPVMNDATVLQQIMRTLTNIQTGMEAMEARIDTRMDAKLAAMEARINTRFDAIDNRISESETRIERRLDVMDHNTVARFYNWDVKAPEQRLEKLKTSMNVFPDGFPETLGQLSSLSVARTDALLAAYGLPIIGNIASKRKSLRQFLGAIMARMDN